jgi:hypothetical protein
VRLLSRPESLTFLDRVEKRLEKLNLAADDLETALRVEWLRRRPGLLSGESSSSGARRAWWIATSVRLSQDARQSSAVEQVRATYRQSWRASSLVEGINSVVRMQQARHRRLTPGLVRFEALSTGTAASSAPAGKKATVPTSCSASRSPPRTGGRC